MDRKDTEAVEKKAKRPYRRPEVRSEPGRERFALASGCGAGAREQGNEDCIQL
ncbi:MAG: hypothetical protein FJ087_12575 [Deltaproteobacteria bacterium]|nr:hypothetical protein [Deltaproteobacteria bacterium]